MHGSLARRLILAFLLPLPAGSVLGAAAGPRCFTATLILPLHPAPDHGAVRQLQPRQAGIFVPGRTTRRATEQEVLSALRLTCLG